MYTRITINRRKNKRETINSNISIISILKMIRGCRYLLLITFWILNASAAEISCVDSGSCLHCERAEMNEEYCLATGKKIKVICYLESNQKLIDYKSCKATPSEDRFHFIVFQFIMAVVGGLAYWGVQTRKQSQLTLFEDRKQRYVYSHYLSMFY